MSELYIRIRERCRALANRYGACSAFVVGGGGIPIEVTARVASTDAARVEVEQLGQLLAHPDFFMKLYAAGDADLCTPGGAVWAYVVSIPNRGVLALGFDDRTDLPDDARAEFRYEALQLAKLFEAIAAAVDYG